MIRAAAIALVLASCAEDESVSGYADTDAVYSLQSIGAAAFTAKGTITFPEKGRVAGMAPCNSYSASQSVPYPWFQLGPILTTKRACPDLAAETMMLQTLAKMTLVEVSGDQVILSDETGLEMLFTRTRD